MGVPRPLCLPLVWVSGLYVGCVSRPICRRACVPRPPCLCYPLYGFRGCTWGVCRVPSVGVCVCPPSSVCYPLYGFQCCTWGVCRVPSVGVCVSPRPLCEPVYGFGCTRGVFHVTIVGVWVSPVYCSLITWSLSPPGVDTYFFISLRSICYHRNTVSPQLQHSNILFLKLPWWS